MGLGAETHWVQGQRLWLGVREQSPLKVAGILISDAKNKIEAEKINSNKSQMEKIGARAKRSLNRRWRRWCS